MKPAPLTTNQVKHVSFSPLGGAGAVATRLIEAQRAAGWTADMISMVDRPFPQWGLQEPTLAIRACIDHYIVRKDQNASFFSCFRQHHGQRSCLDSIVNFDGVVHLHWIPGMITLPDLFHQLRPAGKIIWSVHDLWLLTGGCHYTNGCDAFRTDCKACPQVKHVFQPTVQRHFEEKSNLFRDQPFIHLVGASRWTQQQIKRSAITKDCQIHYIPNPVDTKTFTPGNHNAEKRHHNINADTVVIGLGAANLSDERKQIRETLDALQQIQSGSDIQVVVFGSHSEGLPRRPGIRYLGTSPDEATLCRWYRMMDVYVSMSRYETFGNTLAEAAACGTPSLALNGSGMNDVIDNGSTGYMVNGFTELNACIKKLLQTPDAFEQMGNRARRLAVEQFDTTVVTDQFTALYQSTF